MQTFLPYESFPASIECLDNKRLGKQRVEAFQILNILLNRTNKKGWRNHPAVKMWTGYENALKSYLNICINEWTQRGFVNNMEYEDIAIPYRLIEFPHWLGDNQFHNSHKSNLLRKNKAYYGRFGWKVEDNLPYIWPKGKK